MTYRIPKQISFQSTQFLLPQVWLPCQFHRQIVQPCYLPLLRLMHRRPWHRKKTTTAVNYDACEQLLAGNMSIPQPLPLELVWWLHFETPYAQQSASRWHVPQIVGLRMKLCPIGRLWTCDGGGLARERRRIGKPHSWMMLKCQAKTKG